MQAANTNSTLKGADLLAQERLERKAKMQKRKEEEAAKEAAAKEAAQRRPPLKKMKASELEDALGQDLEMETIEPQRLPASRPQQRSVDDDAGAGLPHGWLACPAYGRRFDSFIPCKVPLGEKYNSRIPPEKRFTPAIVYKQQEKLNRKIGMVIDLTNTWKYYNLQEWEALNVKHVKIACAGRDGPPEPEAVSEFVFTASKYMNELAHKGEKRTFILVHCTHGHNRTGAMLCHFECRMRYMSVWKALREFANSRPPGVYKENYISSLFKYYHEDRPIEICDAPGTPEWKQERGAEEEAAPAHVAKEGDLFGPDNLEYAATPLKSPVDIPEPDGRPRWGGSRSGASYGMPDADPEEDERYDGAEALEGTISHEDIIGERVPPFQEKELQLAVLSVLLGHEELARRQRSGRLNFPGSQPVSLASSNLQLFESRPYHVTWKADGTRYMLLLVLDGVYLIDRKFEFRRVQMCFPRRDYLDKRHNVTLLDGEMVVDVDATAGTATRRYLAYDLMCVNGASYKSETFERRLDLIEKEVVQPRKKLEAYWNSSPPGTKGRYLFQREPFRVRRKDFWPLAYSRKVLEDVRTPNTPSLYRYGKTSRRAELSHHNNNTA
uniref:Tyrosine specific protein phosphatases domain-containing protein n=1 Tax=Pyramimonas obovata TaxID=1411642 RepID=A0A7S0RP26_9CHLO|mmetsp:Transcript_38705/g.84189  ORF Transcript_38705/g.84189 Transcript_38705/m.84189 type:complete len:609 (+) Transcript_38705:424-2250(+)